MKRLRQGLLKFLKTPNGTIGSALFVLAVGITVTQFLGGDHDKGRPRTTKQPSLPPLPACAPGRASLSPADIGAATARNRHGARPVRGPDVFVGTRPTSLAVGSEGIWVAGRNGISLIRPQENQVTGRSIELNRRDEPGELDERAYAIALARSSIWVTRRDGKLVEIDRTSRELVGDPIPFGVEGAEVAVGFGTVWVNRHDKDKPDSQINGQLMRVDPCTRKRQFVKLGAMTNTVRIGHEAVWTTDNADDQVIRYDPNTGEIVRIGTDELDDPQDLLITDDAVWVVDFNAKKVRRIDPKTNRLDSRKWPIVAAPGGIASGAGALWIPGAESGDVTRIDLKTLKSEVHAIHTGGDLTDVAVGFDRVWVTPNLSQKVYSIVP